MPEFIFVGSAPPPAEFRQALADAMAATNPVDDLLVLAGRLGEYERKYRMSSVSFAQRYQAGRLDDEVQHCVEWAAAYDLFVKTKRVVEATLMRAAVQPEFAEVMA
ncbi:MAG: hypothetical protein CVU38_14635 [Chloroflexi bacterium HGW-Chloroflexi-1]|nr:MAG: hypothetical protein CVU38_14635 [Chloroflexi bacterium HGW-Chloroflexi-1]